MAIGCTTSRIRLSSNNNATPINIYDDITFIKTLPKITQQIKYKIRCRKFDVLGLLTWLSTYIERKSLLLLVKKDTVVCQGSILALNVERVIVFHFALQRVIQIRKSFDVGGKNFFGFIRAHTAAHTCNSREIVPIFSTSKIICSSVLFLIRRCRIWAASQRNI